MAGGTFPTSVPAYPTISASETLGTMGAGIQHSQTHRNEEADITALASKVGTGAATPVANRVLRGNGTGSSAWSQIGAGDFSAGSIAAADLAVGVAGWVQLGKQVLGSNQAVIDFTSISQIYSKLVISIVARSSGAVALDSMLLRVGSGGTLNTGANYDWSGVFGSATPSAAGEGVVTTPTSTPIGSAPGSSAAANEAVTAEVTLPAYAGTTFNKGWICTARYRSSTTAGSIFTEVTGGDLRATTAIDTIRLLLTTGCFITGSQFVLWGAY